VGTLCIADQGVVVRRSGAPLRCEVEGQIRGQGLDPHVGFLHVERSGRPALALDLMEESRTAIVDRLALRCLNLRQIQERHCEDDEERGCRLAPAGRETYVREYHRVMTRPFTLRSGKKVTWRRVLHLQAREPLEAIRAERAYRPSEAPL
jgi:CRISP-associated protein Cas1